jgi:hypothetical protein
MRKALSPPPTMLVMAKSTGRRSQMDGITPSPRIASIIRGIIQSEADVSRAKSDPLIESFIPAQLTCSQGRKKQRRMNAAVPRVTCRAFFTKINLGDERLSPEALSPLEDSLLRLPAKQFGTAVECHQSRRVTSSGCGAPFGTPTC